MKNQAASRVLSAVVGVMLAGTLACNGGAVPTLDAEGVAPTMKIPAAPETSVVVPGEKLPVGDPTDDRPVAVTRTPPSIKPFTPKACPKVFADALQTFDIEIAPAEWAKLEYEHKNAAAIMASGGTVEHYVPLTTFRHEGKVETDAVIRLRGNPTWWAKQDKMQFQISFKENNPDGRFRGLRKVVLDSAHYNASYLRDRLAMSVMRDAGLPAPCVNHARLVVNGNYYGLFTHIEKVDREFLERHFHDPSHNLYKRGQILKTNEDENPDQSRMEAFWKIDTIAELEAMTDLDELISAWAAEAVFPDADGYWSGGWNFYLYDDPARGFVYLPWDMDLGFDNLPAETDPITWHKISEKFNGRPHVALALSDAKWRRRFVEEVRRIHDVADPQVLQDRIDRWSDQIAEAAAADSHAPWTFSYHQWAVKRMHGYVAERAKFLDQWLACQEAHLDDPTFDGACP